VSGAVAFPQVTAAQWRALVEKELAGKPFDKALVYEAAPGVAVQPLYTEAPGEAVAAREPAERWFRVCMRVPGGDSAREAEEIAGGAEALWVPFHPRSFADLGLGPPGELRTVFDPDGHSVADVESALRAIEAHAVPCVIALDPLGHAAGCVTTATMAPELAALGRVARLAAEEFPAAITALVATERYHDAGADAVDELGVALSTGARYLHALVDAGLTIDQAAARVAVRMAVGRDTFLELCKLRALRVCWGKLLVACGAPKAHRLEVHAVCSARTLSARDPWVNMLRVTTQVFAAVLGGADLVTPSAFDEALSAGGALGRRVARNTGLVLREESGLGRVADPGGGSYYVESVTDALARAAWQRMREIEAEGGIVAALENGKIQQRIEAAWQAQLRRIVTRKQAVLGVSEFANLDEVLPAAPVRAAPGGGEALPAHRDAEAFEALRARAEQKQPPPEALLSTLGPFAESRARAGFAAGFFAAGGIRTREGGEPQRAAIACVCGSDERYAAEAVERVRALKAAGCGRVLLAGKPGENEKALREAGVDGFVFVGCDVVGVLGELLEVGS